MARPPIPDGQPMSERTLARRRKAAGLSKPQFAYSLDETFFDTWNDYSAWMLGLIWSDGCLFRNTIEICSKDLQLLELVMALIGGGQYALKNGGRHIRVYFTSAHIAAQLRAVGLTEKKSLTIGWPAIPEEWEPAFMRGLIDGDGSVLERHDRPGQRVPDIQVQLVTASPSLRDGITNWLLKHGITYSLSVREHRDKPQWHPLWRFSVVRQSSLRQLYHLLYSYEDVVCLHRKHAPFQRWMETERSPAGRPRMAASP
jgi:hypothetical protein